LTTGPWVTGVGRACPCPSLWLRSSSGYLGGNTTLPVFFLYINLSLQPKSLAAILISERLGLWFLEVLTEGWMPKDGHLCVLTSSSFLRPLLVGPREKWGSRKA